MPLGIRRGGETKDRRRVQDDREAVRHERMRGLSGIGRLENGIAVNDSIAWLRMSRPDDAATEPGIVLVFSGSSRPSVGLRRRFAMPVFACMLVRSKIVTPVVSLPVPAVVG